MRHRLLGLGALALSVLPVLALACSDSAAPNAVGPEVPDGGGGVEDGAPSPDASVAPITVKVRLTALKAPSAYVVFYPTASPENPVVEVVADGQSVSKPMPDGAHIVIVVAVTGNSFVVQVDDVASGETVDFDASRGAGAALDVRRLVPKLDGQPNANYRFQDCRQLDFNVTAGDEQTTGTFDPLCIEPDNKVRFLAMATPQNNGTPLAIGAAVVDLATAGTPPLAAIGSWTTPPATTWSFSGTTAGASAYTASAIATNSTTFGGFPLSYENENADQAFATSTFLRPPAGFNDGELHWAGAVFPTGTDDGSETSMAALVDRTSPSAAGLATDFSQVGPHFSAAPQVTVDEGSANFAFQASAAFPAGTTFVMTAVRVVDQTAGASWVTITTRGEQNRLQGLHLPDAVRQVAGNVDWSQSNFIQARAITGVDAPFWRARPFGTFTVFGMMMGGDYGLPHGDFHAKVAAFDRRSN